MTREDVTFSSGTTDCAAWLYRPGGPGPFACLVMAHGLGGTRTQRLQAFAERFVAAGYACLVFDYRHWGDSGGRPRQLLSIRSQLDDWRAAIAFARGHADVDADRVVVWGTSFSGGHAIRLAGEDHRLAAAVAQGPFTSGVASSLALGPVSTARLLPIAIRDQAGALAGRPPIYAPAAGPPRSAAFMTAPDAQPGYAALSEPGTAPPNRIAARFAFRIPFARPGRHARKVRCPILFHVCREDSVAPSGPTRRYAARAPRGTVELLDHGHFDIYVGDAFEAVVARQVAFLREHVALG